MAKSRFKYLDAYQKEDFDHFFGRNREIARLYNAVNASNLILLYGASGTGKTSLVNCGLANKFYDTDWLPVFVRREQDLLDSIQKEFNRLMKEAGNDIELKGLNLNNQVEKIYGVFFRTIYLIFDQFEELYILGKEKERHDFYQKIRALLKAKLPCKVLLIIREEYLAYLSDFEKVVPALFDNRIRVEKMNNQNLYRVIKGIARHTKILIKEPAQTIPAIIKNITDTKDGVELGHLQIYLERLSWKDDERRLESRTNRQTQFDPELVGKKLQLANVISDFVSEQIRIVRNELIQLGWYVEGLELEVLFALVTDEGTNRVLSEENILERVSLTQSPLPEAIAYCIRRYNELKLVRIIPDE